MLAPRHTCNTQGTSFFLNNEVLQRALHFHAQKACSLVVVQLPDLLSRYTAGTWTRLEHTRQACYSRRSIRTYVVKSSEWKKTANNDINNNDFTSPDTLFC